MLVGGFSSQPGPYVIRVKVPGGVKLMLHRYPEDRIYMVISGKVAGIGSASNSTATR